MNFMKRALSWSIAAAAGLLLSHTAEAQGRFGGFVGGGGRAGMAISGGSARSVGTIAGRSVGGHAFMAQGRSFSGPIHSFSGSFGSNAFVHNPAVLGHANFHHGIISRPVNTIAFGGSTIHGFNRGVGFNHAPAFVTRGWDFGHSHVWNNHHFGRHNGSWVIIDNGYPYDYGSYGYPYGYPSDYGYGSISDYPPGYAYDNGSDYSTATVPASRDNPGDNRPAENPANANSTGDLIVDVQQALANAGYDPGQIDGELGPQSKSAIASFQRENGLAVTGRITRATLLMLGIQ